MKKILSFVLFLSVFAVHLACLVLTTDYIKKGENYENQSTKDHYPNYYKARKAYLAFDIILLIMSLLMALITIAGIFEKKPKIAKKIFILYILSFIGFQIVVILQLTNPKEMAVYNVESSYNAFYRANSKFQSESEKYVLAAHKYLMGVVSSGVIVSAFGPLASALALLSGREFEARKAV